MAGRMWSLCLLGVLAIAPIAGPLGCAHTGTAAPADGEALSLRVLENGTFSGFTQDAEHVFRTSAEWEGFYRQHRPEPPPPVDFSHEMVVAVTLARNTGGFDVAIDSVVLTINALIVTYTEVRPSPEAVVIQVLTQPFAFVAVPRHTVPVRFVHQTVTALPP